MNDLESLVRETLVDPRRRLDPDPQHYHLVSQRVHVLRRRRAGRWTVVAAALVTAVALSAGTLTAGPHPHPGPAPTTATPSPATHGLTVPVASVTDRVVDAAATPQALYFLASSPFQVEKLDPSARQVTATAQAPEGAFGMAVDPAAGRLWVWSPSSHGSTARAYDTNRLTVLRDVTIPGHQPFAGTAYGGDLWVSTDGGLYRATTAETVAQQVPGVNGDAFGLAADPGRGRIVVAGNRIAAVDPATLHVTEGGPIGLFKSSVAVVGGRIWVGGYTDGDRPRVVRIDPTTLRVTGTSPVSQEVGPGAVLWPGSSVVWVRNGGDVGLSCIDPTDGRVLQQWLAVQGPAASIHGAAIAANDGQAIRLVLDGGCAG
jgi:DNA-binding beta-propeller fold protein YncE